MKNTKKAISILLTLLMVVGMMSTFAFAATGTITIENPQDSQEYTASKVFDVVYNSNGNYSYTIANGNVWLDTVQAFAATHDSGLELQSTTSDVYNVKTTSTFSAAKFAAYLKNANITDNDAVKGTLSNDRVTISVSALGYYFVSSTTGTLCNITTTNPTAEIYDKNEGMAFDKTVDKGNADIGENVTFTITGKVPSTVGYTNYVYTISDTMSAGLTFNNNIVVKIGNDNVTSSVDIDTTVTGKTFTLNIPKTVLDSHSVGSAITVTYTATVNKDAVSLNKNIAQLTYSYDPTANTTKNTPEVEAKVYTAAVQIDKVNGTSANKEKLAGAEFVLTKNVDGKIKYYKATATAENNKVTNVEWVDSVNDANHVKTDASGVAKFEGIKAGAYSLVETKAPDGFNVLTAPYAITVSNGTSTTELEVTDANIFQIENFTGTELPSTGGIGTTIFYLIGAILVIGAGVVFITRRRMHSDK